MLDTYQELQLTHPRGVRQEKCLDYGSSYAASTHALLRRATWGLRYITQHTCEATTPALLRRATVIDDFAVHSNAATTHALLRRATAQCKLFHDKTQSYNSRFPAESDSIIIVRPSHIVRYNSRSPAESDPENKTVYFRPILLQLPLS